jgi:hypothetical protein
VNVQLVPLTSHEPPIVPPLALPLQVAGTPVPEVPVYENRLPEIEPLVDRDPERHVTAVIAQPACVIEHRSEPHAPSIAQLPDRLAHAAGASGFGPSSPPPLLLLQPPTMHMTTMTRRADIATLLRTGICTLHTVGPAADITPITPNG